MEKHAFDTMKNGYNRYQVEDFVQSQKLQIESLQIKLENESLIRKKLEEELTVLKREHSEVCENLQVKEKAADEMARIAMKEANRVVEIANQNADVIIREALMMAREILMDIARLGNEANEMKDSMRDELERIRLALDEFETPNIPDMDLLKKEL